MQQQRNRKKKNNQTEYTKYLSLIELTWPEYSEYLERRK
jgi:hypothetical protein